MKFNFLTFTAIMVLLAFDSLAQETSKLMELRGRIDVVGNAIIEILPTNEKKPGTNSEARVINLVVGKHKGKAIDILNDLATKGYELITAIYIANDNLNNFNGNFLLYYLKKAGSKKE